MTNSPKPNREQAQSAASIIDTSVSRMDCSGLTLLQARDLITAVQVIAAYVASDQPADALASVEGKTA